MIGLKHLTPSMAALLLMTVNVSMVSAQTNDLEQKVKTYFQQKLKVKEQTFKDSKEAFIKQSLPSSDMEKVIKGKDLASCQSIVWKAWCEANE